MKNFFIIIIFFLSFNFLYTYELPSYLIITSEKYIHSNILDEFITYRSAEFSVEVIVNTDIGSDDGDFKSYLMQKNPNYVLLVGNYTDFPAKTIPYTKPVESYNYWVANKIDSLYEIKIPIGLFIVKNEEELENIINKTILFEQNLDIIPKKIYTHSGSIEELEPWPLEFNDEILNEMYNSFFRSNGYLHRHVTPLDDTHNDINSDIQAINNGIKYFLYHGHGNINKWSFGMGVNGLKYLENNEYFPIIFSASCLTGTFSGEVDSIKTECFATNMLASENGAVAFIGAYNISSKGQNPLLFGFCKNIDQYERLGDVMLKAYNNKLLPSTVSKYYPHVNAFEYNRARFQFHIFGDPALRINNWVNTIQKEKATDVCKIYPNPANDFINLSVNDINNNNLILIYNNLGNVVKTVKINSLSDMRINISNLPAGIYVINYGIYSYKFIKM